MMTKQLIDKETSNFPVVNRNNLVRFMIEGFPNSTFYHRRFYINLFLNEPAELNRLDPTSRERLLEFIQEYDPQAYQQLMESVELTHYDSRMDKGLAGKG